LKQLPVVHLLETSFLAFPGLLKAEDRRGTYEVGHAEVRADLHRRGVMQALAFGLGLGVTGTGLLSEFFALLDE